MQTFWLISCIAALYVHLSNTFNLPLKKTDETLDTEHVIGHVTLLEQLVTTLQQTVTSQGKDISALTNEIASLKAYQQKAEAKIFDETQIRTVHVTAEMTSLKNEVNAAKTEIRLVSNEAISLSSQLNNLTHNVQRLSARVNSTGAARDAQHIALSWQVNSTCATTEAKFKVLDQKYQTLFSLVNSTGAKIDAELNALSQKYQILSLQVKCTRYVELGDLKQQYMSLSDTSQNMTVIVDDVQSTLARILTEVYSAQTDRFLLHSDVTRLNKSITDTTTKLSAKISQQQTEVWFESWMVNSTVTNGMILKFSIIKFNSGGGYNASSGMFKTPVSGTYLFWTQVEKWIGSNLTLYIHNGDNVLGYFSSPTVEEVTGSVITSANLTIGQQVYVQIYGAKTIDTGYESRFGGTLLYAH